MSKPTYEEDEIVQSTNNEGNDVLKSQNNYREETTDVLICGTCTFHCSDVKDFIFHKTICPNEQKLSHEELVTTSTTSTNIYSIPVTTIGDYTIPSVVNTVFSSVTDSNKTTIEDIINSNSTAIKVTYETFSDMSGNHYMIENYDSGTLRDKEKVIIAESEEPSIQVLSEEPNWEIELAQAKKISLIENRDEDITNFPVAQIISDKNNEDVITVNRLNPTDCCEVELQSSLEIPYTVKTNPQMIIKCTKTKQSKDENYSNNVIPLKNSEFWKMCTFADGSLKCSFDGCNFSTKHKKNIIRHYTIHTKEKAFSCSFCNAKFSRQDKQRLHEKIHGNDKPHACQEPGCSYRSVDKTGLKKHMRRHLNERPYNCQLCTYSAKDASQLAVHLRSHTGDTPYHCQTEGCLSTFRTSSDLKRHELTHSGLKPFKCTSCSYAANVRYNLNVHMKRIHGNGSKYDCEKCNLKFNNGKKLIEHRKLHNEDNFAKETRVNVSINYRKRRKRNKLIKQETMFNFVCEECNSTFVRKDSYMSHKRQHRQINSQQACDEIVETEQRTLIIQDSNFSMSKQTPPTESDKTKLITSEQISSKPDELFDSCLVAIDEVCSENEELLF